MFLTKNVHNIPILQDFNFITSNNYIPILILAREKLEYFLLDIET